MKSLRIYINTVNTWEIGCEEQCRINTEAFSRGHPVPSQLLVCPTCYEVWAKLLWIDDRIARPQLAPCVKCPSIPDNSQPYRGSLLPFDLFGHTGYNQSLLEALPEMLLRREFNLTLEAFENDNSSSTSNTTDTADYRTNNSPNFNAAASSRYGAVAATRS